ncbi:MAG: hypothetical protein RBR41_09155 [Desulfovibrio sp.]|uniref:hypothetical protein n=1 Tax=Desulfovibrio sp. TaxID=885 RepID=UPI002A36AE28|nr:hypothetical protein [Desulfovibrio sp.]MDY0259816.1 hypothetical protein [Desulfovibrio sp.]
MAEGLALALPTAEILGLLPTEGLHVPYHKPDAAVFVVMKKPAWGVCPPDSSFGKVVPTSVFYVYT